MGKYFGTDGIRGIANKDLSPELAYKIGKAAGFVLKKYSKVKNKKPIFLIGKDTRISKDLLFSSLASGLMSVGCDVIDIGIVPTPVVAFLTKKYKVDAGVVISASHNPVEYNGIKFFNSEGFKLNDTIEEEIENTIDNQESIEKETFISSNIGTLEIKDLKDDYIEYITNIFKDGFGNMKIVLDCANGAAFQIAPEIYKNLDANILVMNNTPDGNNINLNAGSTNVKGLSDFVLKNNADIGLAYDGDADRLIAVDENGEEVDGDAIMLLFAKYLKSINQLRNNALVVTVMSNLGLHASAKKMGIDICVTQVGDRYVLEKMVNLGASIGGEQSGHMIFLEYNTTGDGILSSLFLAKILNESKMKLSDLSKEIIDIYPQVLLNVNVDNSRKEEYKTNEIIQKAIKELEMRIGNDGRVLIRHSGTESLIRVMIEGKNYDIINQEATDIANLIKKVLQ